MQSGVGPPSRTVQHPNATFLSIMRSASFAAFILLVIAPYILVGAQRAPRLPVGAVFDKTSEAARSTFSGEVDRINEARDHDMRFRVNSREINVDSNHQIFTTHCKLMKRGTFATLGEHTSDTVTMVTSTMNTQQMPHLTTSIPINVTRGNDGYVFFMRPLYTGAILDYITYKQWNKLHYVYDSTDGFLRLQQLLELITMTQSDVNVRVVHYSDIDHVYDVLHASVEVDVRNNKVLLDLSPDLTAQLLNSRSSIRGPFFEYFHVGLDLLSWMGVSDNYRGHVAVDSFRLAANPSAVAEELKWRPIYWREAGGPDMTSKVALMIDSLRLLERALGEFVSTYPGVLQEVIPRGGEFYNHGREGGIDCDESPPMTWQYGEQIRSIVKNATFEGLSGRVMFDEYGVRQGYQLELIKLEYGLPPQKLGSWTPDGGALNISASSPRYLPLPDETLVITSILGEPFLKRGPSSAGGADEFEGFTADLARILARLLRVDYQIVLVNDGKYGAETEPGVWDGMIGELLRAEADLAIAGLTITSAREAVVDFAPFMNLGISILMRRPSIGDVGTSYFSFLHPFPDELWMMLLATILLVGVLAFLVCKISSAEWCIKNGALQVGDNEGDGSGKKTSLLDCMWNVMAGYMQQGSPKEPRCQSGRVLTGVWWLFSLFMFLTLLSSTINFRRFHATPPDYVDSFEELAEQTEIKFGCVNGGSTMQTLQKSSSLLHHKLWWNMRHAQPSVFVNTTAEGVQRVRQSGGRYALLAESVMSEYVSQQEPCDTIRVGANLNTASYGIATPVGSPLRELVQLALLELRENGEMMRLEHKWWYARGQCGSSRLHTSGASAGLSLSEMLGLFYIVMGGLLLALVVAVFDFIHKSRMDARQSKLSFSSALRSNFHMCLKGKRE